MDFPDIGGTIDHAFNTYLQQAALKRQQDEGRTMQNLQLMQTFGPGVTMEGLQANPNALTQGFQAAQNQGPLPGPQQGADPLVTALADWKRKRDASAALGVRKENAEIGKTEAESVKALAEAQKALHPENDPSHRPTSSEFVARGYADKAEQANQSLAALESKGFNPSNAGNMFNAVLPNVARGGDYQSFDQSRRQFINAILRRESGAAIAPSEMVNYTKQYFVEPGDSPEVIKQKAESRRVAIAGLSAEGSRVPSALGQASGGSDLAARAAAILKARQAGGANGRSAR